jgi:hypothetical protein
MNEKQDTEPRRLLKIQTPNGNEIWVKVPNSPKFQDLNGKQIWERLPASFKLKAMSGGVPVKAIYDLGKEAGKSEASETKQPVRRISAAEVCKRYGNISRSTLNRWMLRRKIPYERTGGRAVKITKGNRAGQTVIVGGKLLFDPDAVERAMQRSRVKAVGD